MKRTRALLTTALPVTLIAGLALAGCSTGGSGSSAISKDASGNACAATGEASQAVQIDGDFGGVLTLASETPTAQVESLQRSVLIDGEGDAFAEGQNTTATWTIFNGNTGEIVNQIPEQTIPNDVEALIGSEWMYELTRCGAEGQRVVGVISADEALAGEDPANLGFTGLEKSDSFVMVLDFTGAEEVCDTVVPRDEKYPEVDLGDGETEPIITVPECMEEPTELEISTLVEGDGAVVQDGDTVSFDYVGTLWRNNEIFDSSWPRGETLVLPTTGVIAGFSEALIGQKVGSTVLSVVPSEQGYNDGEVRVFVIDIREITESAS